MGGKYSIILCGARLVGGGGESFFGMYLGHMTKINAKSIYDLIKLLERHFVEKITAGG